MNNEPIVIFFQVIINGLSNGGVYSLIAVGLTMIVGVLKAVNFAQGDCLTLGLYLTLLFQRLTGLDPLLLLVPTAACAFLAGFGIFEAVIYPAMHKDRTSFTITTLGLSYVIATTLLLVFGAVPQNVNSILKGVAVRFGAFSLPAPRLVSFVIMLMFVIVLDRFLKKTDMGRAMRATAENKDVSQMLGINTRSVARTTFSLGVMFACIAGLLISPTYYLYPSMGGLFNILAMSCVVIGGLGSVYGAVLSSMMVGVLEAMIGTYISVDLSASAAFLLLIFVLIFTPNGLFGKGERIA